MDQGNGSHRARRVLIEKAVKMAVEAVFDIMIRDYDRQFVVAEKYDPSIIELQTSLRELATEAHAKINGPIQLDLARATQKKIKGSSGLA